MNHFKIFGILFLLLLTNFSSFSQSNKITIKTQFELEDVDCNSKTNMIRNIDIQMFYNGGFNSVKKIESLKCSESYIVPKFKGKFKALITTEKYLPTEINFEINDASADTVILKAKLFRGDKTKALEEVVVNSSSSPIKIEGNKTSFLVKNNDALNNGTVLETIQKLPGVLTDLNGNITMKGSAVTVYVDGMPTNMSGQDLTNYLNSISSSSVSKVEIINNPGASYDANTSANVINVVTGLKNKRGINGTLYSATTVYKNLKSENSLTLNGLYYKMNWNLNLGYSNVESENGMHKLIFDKSNGNTIDDNSLNKSVFKPLNIKTGINFPLKNNNFDVKYSFSNNKQNTKNSSEYVGNDNSVITQQYSNGVQNTGSKRNEITTNFMHKFENPEKLFSLNYQFYDFNRNLNTMNDSDLISTQYQNINSNKFSSQINKFKGDLTLPTKLLKINTGFKITNSNILSNGTYTTVNNIFSNTNNILFDYNDFTAAAYSEFYKKYKQLDFTFGLRYEYLSFNNKTNGLNNTTQKYNNIFPSFNIGYQPNSYTDVNLSYSRKVKMPGYQELDPNSSGINNSLVTDGGNPLLKPSFYNNAALKISLFKYASIDFSYSQANNENYFVLSKGSNNAYKQTFESFDNVRNFNSSIAIPIPLGIFTKGLSYLNNINDINNINYIYVFSGVRNTKYDKEGYNNNFNSLYYLGGYSQFILPFDVRMNLQYTFSSKGSFTIYNVEKPFSKFDLTLSKSMFKKSTKIQFSINDVLNTGKGFNALFANDQLTANVATLSDSQRIKFSLTYSFGSYKSDAKKVQEDTDDRENRKSSLDIKL